MQLFYDTTISGRNHTLSAEQSHHAVVVMRRGVGDQLNICDGRGSLYRCVIRVADKRGAVVDVESVEDFGYNQNVEVHLAIAPTKNMDRMEWAVEKAVEIGVGQITPIICDHSERKTIRIDRLQKIVVSAAEQSLKGFLPVVNEPVRFDDFVEQHKGGLIAHCNEGTKIELPRSELNYTILIGPEGDFSPREVDRALDNEYRAITLGRHRLRTETAAVVAVTLAIHNS